MSVVIPHSELTKQAISWICQQREHVGLKFVLHVSIEEACVRFNLSPIDAEFLTRFFREQEMQGKSI